MPTYDEFVFKEIRIIGKAWTDSNLLTGPTPDIEQLFEKIGEMSWRRLIDKKSVRTILLEIGVNPDDYLNDISVPSDPVDSSELKKFPRYGMSVNALLNSSKCNIQETVKRFVDAGVQSTRVNLFTALFPDIDCLPFHFPATNKKWDLFDWNNEYFERLIEIKESMNRAGIQIQWTNYELYSWSERKSGNQQENTPWRNNINEVYWNLDDSMFLVFPSDGWSIPCFQKVCPLLDLNINSFEIGNEFVEKALHERVRMEVLKIVPNALIQVNRNEDTPGQYANMKIGKNYDFISFHGRNLKQLEDLNIVFDKEPIYKTFGKYKVTDPKKLKLKSFIEDCPHDKNRVIFSSDGARINKNSNLGITETYDYPVLGEFFDKMIDLGYNIEHQSRAKMTPPPNHHMIEVDWFLKRSKRR